MSHLVLLPNLGDIETKVVLKKIHVKKKQFF